MLCCCFFYGLVIVLLIMDNKEARGGRRGRESETGSGGRESERDLSQDYEREGGVGGEGSFSSPFHFMINF